MLKRNVFVNIYRPYYSDENAPYFTFYLDKLITSYKQVFRSLLKCKKEGAILQVLNFNIDPCDVSTKKYMVLDKGFILGTISLLKVLSMHSILIKVTFINSDAKPSCSNKKLEGGLKIRQVPADTGATT